MQPTFERTFKKINDIDGAQERTRTSTGLLPLPPQGSASAISPPGLFTFEKDRRGSVAQRQAPATPSALSYAIEARRVQSITQS